VGIPLGVVSALWRNSVLEQLHRTGRIVFTEVVSENQMRLIE
jgi:ABC-type dipeptide/oligopeptide/nickel transport system permease component